MRFSTWSSDVGPSDLLKQQPRGCFDHTPQFAAPADPAAAGRFVTMPDDVRTEMTELAGEHFDPAATFSGGQRFTHRLASRRMRNRFNRSAERRVGTECDSKCRSRWSP